MRFPDQIHVCRVCGRVHQDVQPLCLSCGACSWAILSNPDSDPSRITGSMLYLLMNAVRRNLQHLRRAR